MERLTKVTSCPDGTKIYDISNNLFGLNASRADKTRMVLEKLATYEDAEEQGLPNRWIPCSEGLPETSGYYLACVYDSDVDDFDFRKNWFAHKDDYDMDESEWRELQPFEMVTAWMPLPKPYRESEG